MKHLLRSLTLPLFAVAISAAPAVDFHDHIGIQLWSVRAQIKDQGLPAALDLVKGYGVKEVEGFSIAGVTAPQLAQELKSRGLTAISTHIAYPALEKDIGAAIAECKVLGTKFLICPFPKTTKNREVTEEIIHEMAKAFNTWGAACKKEGIRFGFHPHGLEFRPTAAGNGEVMFDLLARETKPDLVCYEMDVFWAFHAGQDPTKLLTKYPNRWALLHVKDMRKGATGDSTGHAPPADNVTVGEGQINWRQVLSQAQKIGVQYYLLEDETPTPLQCIPDSLKYLRGLKL